MNCINFDQYFADYLSKWTTEHASDYRTYDEMEEDMPRVYNTFLNTPASWLEGITPGAYFTQFEDAKDLVDWLEEYTRRGIPVPDMLLDQICDVGKPCEKRLTLLIKNETAPTEARMYAVDLLREMGSDQGKMTFIAWQMNRAERDELADNGLESLLAIGKSAVQPMLEALPKANEAGQQALLDVLVNYPGNEQVFKRVLRFFKENKGKRALFAGYLAKLGDDRALDDLIEAAKDEDISYVDYIEIRCAIEELGGFCPDRDFSDDPDYEALSMMDGRLPGEMSE